MDYEQRLQLFVEMKRKGITSTAVAQHVNMSNGMISLFFNGKVNLRPRVATKIQEYVENY